MIHSFLLLIILLTVNPESIIDYSKYKLIRIKPKGIQENDFILDARIKYKIDLWNEPSIHFDSVLASVSSSQQQFIYDLEAKKIYYEMVASNLQELIDENLPSRKRVRNKNGSFNYLIYNDFESISKELFALAKRHEGLMQTFSIGESYEKRSLIAVHVGKQVNQKNLVVFECGIHAREWIAPACCILWINWLIKDSLLLNKYQFIFIPIFNPDGYAFTWKKEGGNRLWRRTRSIHTNSSDLKCVGVDLNRIFKTLKFCESHYNSKDPCIDVYCGPYVFSEPETQALRDFVLSERENIVIYFAIHSYGQVWSHPWFYSNVDPPDVDILAKYSSMAAKAIKKVHNQTYKYGSFGKLMYLADGSSVDWVYDTLGVKIVFAIELRDNGTHGFLLPSDQIKPTAEEVWAGINVVLNSPSLKDIYEKYNINWALIIILTLIVFPLISMILALIYCYCFVLKTAQMSLIISVIQ